MPERTFVPPDYYKGSSDYPESKKFSTKWLSQDWGPEKTAIIRESLLKWEAAKDMKQAEIFQDEISEELGESLDVQDLKALLSDLRGEKVELHEDEEESEEHE
ncbi:MAG: hypothetical protein WC526_04540 [Patescibacteria group bacterium]